MKGQVAPADSSLSEVCHGLMTRTTAAVVALQNICAQDQPAAAKVCHLESLSERLGSALNSVKALKLESNLAHHHALFTLDYTALITALMDRSFVETLKAT